MDNINGKWALITGASSGLGVEFARLLAERKANLVLAARRKEPMEKLAEQLRQENGVQVVVEGIDLSVAGAGAELKSRLDRRSIAVDILVNNAGYGLYGSFIERPLQETLEMLHINMVTVTELTHIFAAEMAKRRSGQILLVASLLGYQGVPGYAAYAGSKGYVLLFGESLHEELKHDGVNVTVLAPGPTSTSFAQVAAQRDTLVIRRLMMQPRRVAKTGIGALLRRKPSVVAGLLNKLIVFWNRFTPRAMQRMVMQRAVSG
jgi:uncharacterized protein